MRVSGGLNQARRFVNRLQTDSSFAISPRSWRPYNIILKGGSHVRRVDRPRFSGTRVTCLFKPGLSGLFLAKHLWSIPCSCRTKISHLGARDEGKTSAFTYGIMHNEILRVSPEQGCSKGYRIDFQVSCKPYMPRKRRRQQLKLFNTGRRRVHGQQAAAEDDHAVCTRPIVLIHFRESTARIDIWQSTCSVGGC